LVESFEISVPQRDLDDLRHRLARTRSDDFDHSGWQYGTEARYLDELVSHWLDAYDWRAHEARMNSWSHHRTTIEGQVVHFVLAPGHGPKPLPLVLTHGWPWTFWDFEQVIAPLSDPTRFGGDSRDAFDVVVPALPGHPFSAPARAPLDCWIIGDLWQQLMVDVLGFDRYGAQGGDWGAVVTAYLAHAHADHLVGAHMTFPVMLEAGLPIGKFDPEQNDYAAGEGDWAEHTARGLVAARSHVAVHRGSPHSLAHALADSPAGLLSWIVERRRAFSDCDGDVEACFSKDELITTAALYWFSGTVASSLRFYADHYASPFRPVHERRPVLEAPVGIAVFPRELALLPKRFVARHANLQHWSVMPRGGHFAPSEQPGLLVEDLRAFFRPLRDSLD
jgi:pimeloyl-ACP methyl ester carboxylesterase